MDRILVFDQGRLIEQGTHQQLLGQGGTYWSMWQKQSHLVIDSSGTRARLNAMFLQTVPIFEELSEELLNSLADQFGSELHEADVKIVEQGEIGEKFYVIVRGRVEVLVRHAALTANASGILEDGDFFGEIALLTNSPRTATIRSLDRCLLLTLTRAQFQSVIAREPHLRTGLEAVVAQRLASDAKGM